MRKNSWLLISMLVLLLSVFAKVSAETQSLPIDIPGTNVHFFLLRYTGDTPPYERAAQIWENLSNVFADWVSSGQNPADLTKDMVEIAPGPNNLPAIYLKGTLIVEVDEFHAQVNRAKPEQLAEMWAENLRQGVEAFVQINVKR